jgi:hypothetical protein
LLVLGAIVLVVIARSRRAAGTAAGVEPARQREIASLLEDGGEPPAKR